MGWADSFGDAIRFGMQFREGRRRYGIESTARDRDQELREAAEKRLNASETFERLKYGLEGAAKLEQLFPGIAPEEMEYVQGAASRDPLAAQNDPEFWNKRRTAMEKFGPAAEQHRKETLDGRLALARANHPGFDFAGRARLAQLQAYYRALHEASKTDVPANGMYPFIIDPDSGEARQITPQEIAEYRRAAAEGTAGQIINSPIPGVQGEPNPPIQIRPPPPPAPPNPRLVEPQLGQSAPGRLGVGKRAQVLMRASQADGGGEHWVDPTDADFSEAIKRGWTIVKAGTGQ